MTTASLSAIAVGAIAQTTNTPQAQAAIEEAKRLNAEVVTLSNAGRYDEAIPLAERNLQLVEKIVGPNDSNVAIALVNLVAIYQAKNEFGKAEKFVRRTQAILEKSPGPDPIVTAQLFVYLSNYYAAKEDYRRAEALCQQALPLLQKGVGAEHPSVAVVLVTLAELAAKLKDDGQAESLYQRALTIVGKTSTNDHSDEVIVLSKFASFYKEKKDYSQAEKLYQKALSLQEEVFGAEHPKLIPTLNDLAVLHLSQKHIGQAESLYQRGLAIKEKEFGAEHQGLIAPLRNLANLYAQAGEFEKSQHFVQRALIIAEKTVGKDHTVVKDLRKEIKTLAAAQSRFDKFEKKDLERSPVAPAGNLPNIQAAVAALNEENESAMRKLYLGLWDKAYKLEKESNYAEALGAAKSALAIAEKINGVGSERITPLLDLIAGIYDILGEFQPAELLYQRALDIREKKLGAQHRDTLQSLQQLAHIYLRKGDYAKSESLYKRALVIVEKASYQDINTSTGLLSALGFLYAERGEFKQADSFYQQALTVAEKHSDQTYISWVLKNYGEYYQKIGSFRKAEQVFHQALSIEEKRRNALLASDTKSLRQADLNIASLVGSLADLYTKLGNYSQARSFYQRVFTLWEKAGVPEGHDYGHLLARLATAHSKSGNSEQTEQLFSRAIIVLENSVGPDSLCVADVISAYAEFYDEQAYYSKAETLQQRRLAILQKRFSPEHYHAAFALASLAGRARVRGNDDQAEALYQTALRGIESSLGLQHPYVSPILQQMASLYEAKKDYSQAEKLSQRAFSIDQAVYGPDNPYSISPLGSLASIHRKLKNYIQAETEYGRILEVREKALGVDHRSLAFPLVGLAEIYRLKKDLAKAEPLYQRALTILEKDRRQDAPDSVWVLDSYAGFCREKGDLAQTTALLAHSNAIRERSIRLNLGAGSEQQKLLFLSTFTERLNATISFHATAAPNDPAALKLALETTIRNKGRLLDVMAEGVAALRQRLNPRDRTLLDQLIEARSQLSTLMLRWDSSLDPQQRLSEQKRLETRIEELEAEITTRSTRFNPPTAVTLEMLQAALPRDAKLVEFTTYRPNDSDTDAPLHYLAYVIASQGTPTWVELGAAQPIDEAVKAFRASLRTPANAEVKQRARVLDEKVMQPIRKLLGETRHILLSPDGALNLIPFAALVDEQNRYLVEQYSFTYLSSGRDLLRLQKNSANPQGQWIIADPDFGVASKQEQTATGLLDGAVFTRLPGTADEARALQTILPQTTVLTADKATETALKQVAAPRLLHIATHGFFLDSVTSTSTSEAVERSLFRGTNPGQSEAPAFYVENPLLRSGLVLAGVAARKSGNDDGILTAMEVSGLNLLGTKLVTLSACDTGVGEVKNGNGVYGLRRALVLAGTESQVMSLWPVDDKATRDLMIDYYQRLQAGEGRTEALRQVQLTMLKSAAQSEGDKRGVKPLNDAKAAFAGRSHPSYWASFIQSGEWASLDGKR